MIKDQIVAVVQALIYNGRHGPYAVATSISKNNPINIEGSVTFSLKYNVWEEEKNPETGTWVVLSHLSKKNAGWRANKARFYRPSDEGKFEIVVD